MPTYSTSEILENIDYAPRHIFLPISNTKLYLMEENEEILNMVLTGRCPTMWRVHRTHRVDLDWLIERILKGGGVIIRYIGTKAQLADLLTKKTHLQFRIGRILFEKQVSSHKVSLPYLNPK